MGGTGGMFPVQSLPIGKDQRLAALLYGTNPYDMQPLPAGLNANGLPPLSAPPPGALGSAAADSGGPGPGANASLAPAPPAGLPPSPDGSPAGGPAGPPPSGGAGPDFSPAGMMAMAGLPSSSAAGGSPPAFGIAPGSPSSALLPGAPSPSGPGISASGAGGGGIAMPPPGGPAGGAPPPGALAAGLPGGAPSPGALAAGLQAVPAPMSQADFLAQQGNAPVAGPPTFLKPSRGEKIARDILLGVSTAVNPVAGLQMIRRTAAEPRLEQEALAQYQAQLPAVQQAANVQAYQEYLKSQQAGAEVMRSQAEIQAQQTAQQRLEEEQRKTQATAKANVIMQIQNEASKGLVSPEALEQRWAQYAQANPYAGLTRDDIHNAIVNTPPAGPNYHLVWTGAPGADPLVEDRVGNQYDMSSAPDDEARRLLKTGSVRNQVNRQNELNLAAAKATADAQSRLAVESSPAAIAAKAAQAKAVQQATIGQSNAALADVPSHLIAPATAAAEKAGQTYVAAQQAADDLNTFIDEARAGNKVAYSYAPVQGVLTLNSARGVKRVNMPEIQSYGGAGSAADRVMAYLGKQTDGKSIPPNILNDMQSLHQQIAGNARGSYGNALKVVNSTYGSKFQPVEFDAGAAKGGGGGGVPGGKAVPAGAPKTLDVAKLKANNPNASPAQIQDAIARAQQQGMSVINQ